MNIEWNAKKYSSDFSFVYEYGRDLLSLIDTSAARSALDLGCGNGALTEQIFNMGISVIGMDASESMLEIARENHPDIKFVSGDASDFSLSEPVDLVFSNAVFHWINREKHPQMLKCIYNALKPGGQLVAELGGFGNALSVHTALKSAFEKRGLTYNMTNYFPSDIEYAPILQEAGFKIESISLFDRLTELKGENGLAEWIELFRKEAFKDIPYSLKAEIIRDAAELSYPMLYKGGKWYVDYVRLRFKAVKN